MQKLALDLPLNGTSLGSTSILILRQMFEMDKRNELGLDLYLFPIGGVDLSSQTNLSQDFVNWLNEKVAKVYDSFNRDIPCFKLWHLNGSLASYSKKQTLLSFYELDNPTKVELAIGRNNNLCLSSKFSVNLFEMFGVKTNYLPLAFDQFNFNKTNKKYFTDDRIVFNVFGKFEKRKHHSKIIQSWIKRFGNNPKYALQCATYNLFMGQNPQECDKNNNELIRQLVGGNKPFNVNFYPWMRNNADYNDFLNSCHIAIAMSGGESQDLPCLSSLCLGKHVVALKAHAYTDYCNTQNSVLVSSSGKIPAFDNMFFKQGEPFNQGNLFNWEEDAFISGCEEAIARVQSNPDNVEGYKLLSEYSSEKFVKSIINYSI